LIAVITGAHVIVYSTDADADRDFPHRSATGTNNG